MSDVDWATAIVVGVVFGLIGSLIGSWLGNWSLSRWGK